MGEPVGVGQPKVEYLLCGSPNDAFYSQMAFFRLALDSTGPSGRAARVVAVFGDESYPPMPDRWAPHFERIEVVHANPERFRRERFFAASDLRYELLDPTADVSCICDADTVLIRALPTGFLAEMRRTPAIGGVVAHFPFPVEADTRPEFGDLGLYPGIPHYEAWRRLSLASLGRLIDRPLEYTLLEGEGDRRCPFYINYGFVAGPPILLQKLYGVLGDLQPGLSLQLRNDFYGQVAIALAVEHAHLPWRALPMRFNFPNDRAADLRYPQELDQVVLIHYLRNSQFDRHRIFAERNAFDAFLAMPTIGSDRVLQDHVCRITGGVFPFAQPR